MTGDALFGRTSNDGAGRSLKLARAVDPEADYPSGLREEDGTLLIANEHADAVMALLPGSWRDDNDPPTTWTRIVYPETNEES